MKKIFFFLMMVTLLLPGVMKGQGTTSLPDASSKLPFLQPRASGGATDIPDPSANVSDRDARMSWWRDARFGMFIHWGLYAVPAGEWNGRKDYGEWIRTSAQIPLEEYDKFRPRFNPVSFDADAWVRMAREAGMKYIVITSKHHDGFCMFDTRQTDFNIMTTPFKRDPMKELASACKKYGLKFCFYHSIMDWHHPDYLPRRDWEKDRSAEGADFDRYVAYMKAQLKELLTNYGDIGVLWFDGEWENTWNEQYGKEIYHYVRSLQPAIIVNNRVGAGRLDMEGMTKEGAFGGDFGTPEQQIPATGLKGVDWETCMTMNDHWGYNRADKNFKSSRDLIRMLADIASKGGNYLLNVGPTAEGLIPPESVDRLAAIGHWMKINGEAIYGTTASPLAQTPWGRCTVKEKEKGSILYLHIFDWPASGELVIPGILNDQVKAVLLADRETAIRTTRRGDALVFSLPAAAPDPDNSVLAISMAGKPDITNPPVFVTETRIFVDSAHIKLTSDREKVEIRYTLGKTEPTAASPVYKGPITLSATTKVNARCFREKKPVSGTVSMTYTKVAPLKATTATATVPGIHYRYYEGAWDSLPDFARLTPVKQGILNDFVFTPRNDPERFAFEYSGYVKVPATSVYTFYTSSDDGSRLWIDDRLVVDNDGLHGLEEKQGDVPLEQGLHKIRVGYFERTGGDNLIVMVKSQHLPKGLLPTQWLWTSDK